MLSLNMNMKYNTREIVNRALALTDLTSDFFMGNTELTNLLNDCYTETYDMLIANGDKTFVKTATMSNGQKLPKDFYKMLEVKHNKDFLMKSEDYDIINGYMKLDEAYDSADITYYPNPKVLTLKPVDRETLAYDNVITQWQDGYVLSGSLIDTDGNTIVDLPDDITTYLSNGYIKANDEGSYSIYDYSSSPYTDIKLIVGNTLTYDKVNLTTDVENPIAVITNKSRSFYYILDNNLNLYNEEGTQVLTSFTSTTLYCKEDGLYYISNNHLNKILNATVENFPNAYTIVGILDNDYMSCVLGTTYKKIGYGIDSILDVPCSIFWTYFAYSLAISISNVVQRDTTELEKKMADIKKHFSDSLIYDTNSAYTVRDLDRSRFWL